MTIETYTESLPQSGEIRPALALRSSFSWTLSGNALYYGCRWGVVVLLAKLGSPTLVGEYALGLAIATPILMFANLQLRSVQTTDIHERTSFNHYLGFRIFATLAALLATLTILFVMGYSLRMISILFMVGMSQAVESISDIYYGRFQFHDRMDKIAKSMIARGPFSLFALAVVLYTTRSLFWSVTAIMLARLCVLLLYDARSSTGRRREKLANDSLTNLLLPQWDTGSYVGLLRFCVPLGVVSLLGSLNSQLPRYFIQRSVGTRQVGIFSAMAFLLSSGNLIVQALAQSAFVQMAKHYAAGHISDFTRLLFRLLVFVGMLGLGGVLVAVFGGRQLLTWLYRSEYADHNYLLILVMIAGAIDYLSSVLSTAATSARAFVPQIPLLAVVTIASVLSSLLLIPSHGLWGAGVATIITSVTLLVGQGLLLFWVVRVRRAMGTVGVAA